MNRFVKYILIINIVVMTVLVFVYPHLMISPGPVLKEHRPIEKQCFSCHGPLLGISHGNCISCHKVENIGVLTSKGVPLVEKKTQVPFHQKLLGKNCVSCHSDHAGVAKYRVEGTFSHHLLDNETRNQCIACHKRPGDPLHQQASDQCSQCHGVAQWKPAQFRHDLLSAVQRAQCVTCHKAKMPSDWMHRQASDKCGQCHSVAKWKPATFDHEKSFSLDRDHNVKCTVCHTTDHYKAYTCYGCHEHSVAKIREEHLEEGIRDFDRCVLCHRNADEDDAKRLWKSGGWRGERSDIPARPEGGGVPWERKPHRSKQEKQEEHDD